jgi:L-arabinose isomerase
MSNGHDKEYTFWFITGSQFLYGPETLRHVESNSIEIVEGLNAGGRLPYRVVYKNTMKTAEEVVGVFKEANYSDECAGVITFMHTFSPSKMWINGLGILEKPYLHLHTQFNRSIPDTEIDMDYMNLHQSAHGDREHGFIGARMRCARKVVAGYWEDADVQERIGEWMRAAAGAAESRRLKVMRFGDNMREVAVTEGDKVEVQIKLGWQVNTWPVGMLAEAIALSPMPSRYAGKRVRTALRHPHPRYGKHTLPGERRDRHYADARCGGLPRLQNTFPGPVRHETAPGLATQRIMEKATDTAARETGKVSAMTL